MSTISTGEERIFAEMVAQLRGEPRAGDAPSSFARLLRRHRTTILATIWALSLFGAVSMTAHPAAAVACVVSLAAATAALIVDTATA